MFVQAANKYNAPEVLALLFRALEVAGLADTVVRLKQLGVPRMVNDAWQGREKMGSTLKIAWGQQNLRLAAKRTPLIINANAPAKIVVQLKDWRLGIAEFPEEYIIWHQKLAERSLAELKRQYQLYVHRQRMVDDGWFEGMRVLETEVSTLDGRDLTMRWHDNGTRGGQWMRDTGHGHGLMYAEDLESPVYRTAGMFNDQYVATSELPDSVRRVLREVKYTRRTITVSPATSYSLLGGGGDGTREFVAALNLSTGQYKITWGSWGGANMFNPRNQVDLDDTKRPLPPNGVIISGHIGGQTYATISIHSDNFARLLPAPEEGDNALTTKEYQALQAVQFVSNYRAEEFARQGLGKYGPDNPYVKALAQKGMIVVSPAGRIQMTIKGKNQHPPA